MYISTYIPCSTAKEQFLVVFSVRPSVCNSLHSTALTKRQSWEYFVFLLLLANYRETTTDFQCLGKPFNWIRDLSAQNWWEYPGGPDIVMEYKIVDNIENFHT